MLIANKEEIFTYIEEDFNRLKNYDFHHTSLLILNFVFYLLLELFLDQQDNVLDYLKIKNKNLPIKSSFKIRSYCREYILKQVITYMLNENGAERIRQTLRNLMEIKMSDALSIRIEKLIFVIKSHLL